MVIYQLLLSTGNFVAITDGQYKDGTNEVPNEKVITTCGGLEKRLQSCHRMTPSEDSCSNTAGVQCQG